MNPASQTSAPLGDERPAIEPYVWNIAGVVILGMVMSILDTTIVNVALDTLGRRRLAGVDVSHDPDVAGVF